MPYIRPEIRALLDPKIKELKGYWSPGELNYIITSIVRYSLPAVNASYKDFNDVVGVLECAKQELYRRMVAPYEDKKIKENGDVY